MRRIALLIAYCAVVCSAQSPMTVVSDTITSSSGTHPSGTITLSWTRGLNDANPRQVIFPGSKVVVVTNGSFTTSLFPNTQTLPPGQCFQAAYNLAGQHSVRYWFIPVSATPVNLNQVESSLPCTASVGAAVAPGQITPGAPGVFQVLTSNPIGFVSWVTGGGGGGGNPGGNTGQVQVNNNGSFGGFTPGGDCVLNNPNFICTKTNGVPFAPSATTNALNASNINQGTLPPARGGTGAGVFSQGSIPFAGVSGVYQQDNMNLFYGAGKLGIGTNNPAWPLDVRGTSGFPIVTIGVSTDNGDQLDIRGQNAALAAVDGALVLNSQTSHIYFQAANSNVAVVYGNTSDFVLGLNTLTDGGYKFDVETSGSVGTVRFGDQTAGTGSTLVTVQNGATQVADGSRLVFRTVANNGSTVLSYINDQGSYVGRQFADSLGQMFDMSEDFTGLALSNAGLVRFSSTSSYAGTIDAGLGRTSPGLLEINNGFLGTWRDLKLRNLVATTNITASGLTTTATLTVSGLAGGGTQCLQTNNAGSISGTGSACGAGGAAGALSSLTAATTANTIANNDNAQKWIFTITTPNKSAMEFGEGTASAVAGVLLNVDTLSTSTLFPVQFTAGGTSNGVRMGVTGILAKIGSGGIDASLFNGNTKVAVVDGGTNLGTYNSGGVICATASTTLASSATLTQRGVVIGGGVGACPAALSAAVAGTVLGGLGTGSDPAFTAIPVLGIAGTTAGKIGLAGVTSGTVTIQTAAAAGTWSLTLPTTGGTNGYVLQTDGTGITSWASAGGGSVTVVGAGSLTNTACVTGGGSQTLQTPSSSCTIDASGNLTAVTGNFGGGGVAGMIEFTQGTAGTPGANSIGILAPASVATAYKVILPGAAATGFTKWSNSSGTVTESIVSNVALTIASGTKALATSAISSAACSTDTFTATGTLTSDTVIATFASDPTGVTGYIPLVAGGLTIYVWPTSDTINIKTCNFTASSITPGAISLNLRTVR